MRRDNSIRKPKKEAGIALLIAIFILLLIGVVGIALVVSSGTESALAGNYRSSTAVQYAAVAGLEEVRARLRPNDPNYFGNTDTTFLPAAGIPLGPCTPVYVINAVAGEAVTPWDPANLYYDIEFSREFPLDCGGAPPPNPSKKALSIWNRAPLSGLPFPGPYYKWVRINGVSEQSLNIDTGPTYDGINGNLIYYDGQQLRDTNISGNQVYELTALATLPNGSRKMVQYLIAGAPLTMPPFPAAMTLAGSTSSQVVNYSAPALNSGFSVNGIDQDSPNCSGVPSGAKYAAIGVFNNSDINPIIFGGGGFAGIPATPPSIRSNNYQGLGASPDVEVIYSGIPPTMTSPAGLDAVVQMITQDADATIPTGSNATQTAFLNSLISSGKMSSTSPMTLVVSGDLDLTGWHNTGYGLLLVTGNLTYDPDASWDGIIMVVGQGTVTGSKVGSGVINGAMLVARTRDASGTLLSGPSFGNSYVNFNNGASMGGLGIRYSSCWIQKSQPTSGYKILSFHEIAQ